MNVAGKLVYGLITPRLVDGSCADGSFLGWLLGRGFSIILLMIEYRF